MDFYDLLLAKKLSGGGGGGDITVQSLSVTANGTYTAPEGKAYSPVNVNVQPPQEAEAKDVNFFDYDGTCLYSYTFDEWENVTGLPANPVHDGLISQGWNWTKELIDEQIEASPDMPVQVGQCYITQSDATEIDIVLQEHLNPYVALGINGSVEIDWGDGSKETVTGASASTRVDTGHTYSSAGNYTIKISLISGSYVLCGGNTTSDALPLINKGNASGDKNYMYSLCLRAVRVGNLGTNDGLGSLFLAKCDLIEYITLPINVKPQGVNAFHNARVKIVILGDMKWDATTTFRGCSAKTVCLPQITSGSANKQQMFQDCSNLENITFLKNAKLNEISEFQNCILLPKVWVSDLTIAIPYRCFNACRRIAKLTIPSSVTTIGQEAFAYMYSCTEFHFKRTTPPTADSNIISNIVAEAKIYVPYSEDHSILEAYKTASNWSQYASYMQEESA